MNRADIAQGQRAHERQDKPNRYSSTFDGKSRYLAKLLVVLDLSVVALVYTLAVKAYPFIRGGETLDELVHLGLLPIVLVGFAMSRRVSMGSSDLQRESLRSQSVMIFQEILLTLGILLFAVFLLKLDEVSRAVIVVFAVTAYVSLVGMRRFLFWWYAERQADAVENHLKVLVIGSGRRARSLADQLQQSSEWGIHIIGFLDPKGESAGRRDTDEILGHVDQISEILRDNVVEDVVVAVPRDMLSDIQMIIDACQEEGVRLQFMADLYDFRAQRIRLSLVNDIPLLVFEPVARDESALLVKRIFDIVVTLAAMPLLLPILALTAIAIKLEDPGPAFFNQQRVGLHKRLFKMYKFRSMVVDAEARMKEVEHLNEAKGPNFKIKDDPRVTRVGRFIRKTSIDELPQLFNVLLGDMSLVGPRPMSIRDVQLFDKGVQRKRFSVRPGITCLWQVSGRSDLEFDDWLRLDLEYIGNWSFWLDLKILFRTVYVVLMRKGAS
jgi:exopolysaccharide biosynthesis polyprenyl glycosylphosphotransferase